MIRRWTYIYIYTIIGLTSVCLFVCALYNRTVFIRSSRNLVHGQMDPRGCEQKKNGVNPFTIVSTGWILVHFRVFLLLSWTCWPCQMPSCSCKFTQTELRYLSYYRTCTATGFIFASFVLVSKNWQTLCKIAINVFVHV